MTGPDHSLMICYGTGFISTKINIVTVYILKKGKISKVLVFIITFRINILHNVYILLKT